MWLLRRKLKIMCAKTKTNAEVLTVVDVTRSQLKPPWKDK